MKKTALVLSGGGSRGAYGIGVWKALKELDIKIDMVMGTSVGAINGALIAQGDIATSEDLWKQLETHMVFDVSTEGSPVEDALSYAKEIVLHGGAGTSGLEAMLNQYLDEDTVRSSNTDYGLVVTEFPSMEPHFMYIDDIPQGQLQSYILASASCFPAVQKCIIGDKQFIDGGYRDNLPLGMAMERGATSIIAVDLHAVGHVRKDVLERAERECEEFHMLQSSVDLGNFLVFDKATAERIMTAGRLDTLKYFGMYDGIKYTFEKEQFNNHQLIGAENAAEILDIDPCVVYSKESLLSSLKQAISRHTACCDSLADYLNNSELRGQLLLYMARSLRDDQEKSLFMQPPLFNTLRDELQAANFLVMNNLI